MDFMIHNLQSYVSKIEAMSNDVTHIDDLLISTVSQPLISKFSIFVWITTIFISISALFKAWQAYNIIKPFLTQTYKIFCPKVSPPPNHSDFFICKTRTPSTLLVNQHLMLCIFKQRERFCIYTLATLPLIYFSSK